MQTATSTCRPDGALKFMSLNALFEAARDAQARAYAPYSGFKVGAAVQGEGGAVYAGCNVENAAFPVGTCAEQGAIAAMIAAGERRIKEILVLGEGRTLVTPCGACRQRIREFATPDTPVHVAGPDGVRSTFALDDLLPCAFGPDNLQPTSPA
jgi:cytidine deaminase